MTMSRKLVLLSAVAFGGVVALSPGAQARHGQDAPGTTADSRARDLLSRMTLQDKLSMVFTIDGGGTMGNLSLIHI